MYKWFLAWRYLHTKMVAVFGIAAVTLCVALVIVVLSVMGGFLDTIKARSRGLHSEIVLENGILQGFPLYGEFGAFVAAELPEVVRAWSPVVYSYAIFRVPATSMTKPARVLGIRLNEYVQFNDFAKGLNYERYYPGTTRLDPQAMPVAGQDAEGRLTLPEEYLEANARWHARETDQEKLREYERSPFEVSYAPRIVSPTNGERVFQVDSRPPGYVGEEYHGVIVGCDLLFDRRADGNFDRYLAKGSDIALTVLPLTPAGNFLGEKPSALKLRYVDDSRTGIFEIDDMTVYVDFDMLQRQLAMDPQDLLDGGQTKARANQLLIGLKEGVDLDAAAGLIAEAWAKFYASIPDDALTEADRRALDFVSVYTWEDLQRPLIAAVEKEKVLVTFLFGLISLVAIVLIGLIFYMIVEKKTKDIGILKAIGASPRGVATMFILYAAAVGIAGAILGTLIGSVFVWNINDIQDLLASLNPQLRVWSPEIYSFDRIPEEVKRADALWVASIAVLSSMVGAVIPAILAGRVWPVAALRYE